MTEKFLHIGINFKSGQFKTDELNVVFDNALDWLRYAPNCWIVWTNATPEVWFQRLKAALNDADTFFICEINMNVRNGWMPKQSWEWMAKHHPLV
jgi:hypothetical protein